MAKRYRGTPPRQPLEGPVKPADTARRTLLVSLAAMSLPVILCLVIYTLYSGHTMQQEIYRNMQMSVEQAKNNLDFRMAQLEKSALSILSTVVPYLNSHVAIDGQLDEYSEISRVLTANQIQNSITKLRLYVPDEKLYSHQRDMLYPLGELPPEDSVDIASGPHWQEPHDITVQFTYPQVSVISCVTAISSTTRYNHIVGVLFLDMDITPFEMMLSAGIAEDAALFLVNQQGDVLIHPDGRMAGVNLFDGEGDMDMSAPSMQAGSITLNGETNLVVSRRLNSENWYLVMTVPRSNVYSRGVFSLDIVRLILLILILGSLIMAVAVTYSAVVRNTVRRINTAIDNTIDTMNRDGLDPIEREDVQQGDPTLATLEHNTNLMAATITHLLESRYQDQLAVRDFQMKALQAQINPHFLYNTLDVIKWMIADGRNEDSVWMINALSRYFQLSLSSGRDIVRMEEEIHLTRTYIGIMQKRFQGVFTAQFDVEPGTEKCLIPKLSLQPIIENALLHGILYAEKPEKSICVRIMQEDGRLIIEVEDNGNGIDDETLETIRSTGGDSRGKSYGLSNVIRRLRLFGAGEDGFEIYSRIGVGTCVTLRLPARLEEEA